MLFDQISLAADRILVAARIPVRWVSKYNHCYGDLEDFREVQFPLEAVLEEGLVQLEKGQLRIRRDGTRYSLEAVDAPTEDV